MTQSSFCVMFGFSLDTLKHWEGHRRTPDTAARAYLTVIAMNPLAVMTALREEPTRSKEKIMKNISAEEFRSALETLGPRGGKQVDFLKIHAEAPGRAMNADALAKAVGYENWRAINLHYGTLAFDLGNILNRSEDGFGLLCEYAEPGTLTNKEGVLVMRSEFAEGLRLANWI